MKNIIMTGATGILGTAIITECIQNNIRVTAVARPSSSRLDRIPKSGKVNVIKCGLDELNKLPELLPGKHEVFYHLGWADIDKSVRNDAEKQERNIKYTINAVEAANRLGCKVFIGAGSQAEYGRYDTAIKEEFETKPGTVYGKAKLEAGKSAAGLCAKYKIKFVWPRIFSIYGLNDGLNTFIMYCISKLLKKEKPSLTACTQIWDYLYCSDAAKALILLAEKGMDGQVYNVASGIGLPLLEYVNIIRNAIDPRAELGVGDLDQGRKLMNLYADITKIKKHTGFKPMVSFKHGIKETIKWYKENIK